MRFQFEIALRRRGYALVAGIDEAGRGPLAGPVVAAAVILPDEGFDHPLLDDSKKLSAPHRAEVAAALRAHPGVRFALAEATPEEIDTHNILRATLLAMRRAVEALSPLPHYLLIDGRDCPPVNIPGKAIIKGDSKVPSISAASILAKEARDATMIAWAATHPEYGFEIHKGYGTAQHLAALRRHGPTPLHRRSFAPVGSEADPGLLL
ncbi:ribonuclease HII [Verrucomicrobium sp. GAS474]|uniref:ribonuclease HII n=1 Tax=Verrucomicrobium sp. GAS474 TaxID=1882831 RepID=UPI001E43658E|nr:ribonuclease HII [Verrucomicrobium sp. GAS474]